MFKMEALWEKARPGMLLQNASGRPTPLGTPLSLGRDSRKAERRLAAGPEAGRGARVFRGSSLEAAVCKLQEDILAGSDEQKHAFVERKSNKKEVMASEILLSEGAEWLRSDPHFTTVCSWSEAQHGRLRCLVETNLNSVHFGWICLWTNAVWKPLQNQQLSPPLCSKCSPCGLTQWAWSITGVLKMKSFELWPLQTKLAARLTQIVLFGP